MDISIRSRNVDITEPVRMAVEEKVTRVTRILSGMDRAEVRFHEERNPRIAEKEVCEVTIHGHGHIVRARAAAPETLIAVDRVVDKLSHRMEKLKGKLVGRSHPRRPASLDFARNGSGIVDDAASILVDSDDDESEADEFESFESDSVEQGDGQARIVRTKQFTIKPMTPQEAALQMELIGHDFFFFTNSETEKPAVVYRRKDGDVGLIDAG